MTKYLSWHINSHVHIKQFLLMSEFNNNLYSTLNSRIIHIYEQHLLLKNHTHSKKSFKDLMFTFMAEIRAFMSGQVCSSMSHKDSYVYHWSITTVQTKISCWFPHNVFLFYHFFNVHVTENHFKSTCLGAFIYFLLFTSTFLEESVCFVAGCNSHQSPFFFFQKSHNTTIFSYNYGCDSCK